MERKLEASDKFEVTSNTLDTEALLPLICSIAHKHEDEKGRIMSLVEHKTKHGVVYMLSSHHWTNAEYYGMFKAT